MRAPLIWAGGLIGSVAAHGVAFAFLNLSVEPDPTPTQPKPETQLTMDAYQVDRQDAPAQQAESEAAPETQGETTDLSQGTIPQSRSEAQEPKTARLSDAPPPSQTLSAAAPPTATVSSQTPDTDRIAPAQSESQALQSTQAPTATIAPAKTPTSNRIAQIANPTQTISSLAAPVETIQQAVLTQPAAKPTAPKTQSATQSAPKAQTAAPVAAPTETAQSQALDTQTATNVAAPTISALSQSPDAPIASQPEPNAQTATSLPAPSEQADQPPLPAEFATASLAFNFGDRVVTDPAAIATIQAFMAPQAIDGSEQVRDGLSSLLSSVDCARLSATYIPETGALELRGHVPDNALRAPVLKALQDQIGEGITVTDNLLHLPKPQCGALTGIADIGLPQSTDQLTNKRLIGDNAQAVEYTYSEGQPLAFDLTAPDYDAVVYVDYFDADGQVIHLVPNEVVPLQAYRAKEVVGIERGDGPKLNITIGPPYGQEIAVAFAASRPLFAEVRPLIEPAEPYLEFLKTKVAEARELDPDFKGEWVYFFITTQPAS